MSCEGEAGRQGHDGFIRTAVLETHSSPPLQAAGQTEGRGDGGEDGDDHVDDQLPGLFLAFL